MTKPGRNDPCPCGSEKKYKKCCLGSSDAMLDERIPPSRDRAAVPSNDPLLAWLSRTSRTSAIASIGALVFHGDGAWRAHSLERAASLACLAAQNPTGSSTPVDPNELQNILAKSRVTRTWRVLDDPPEFPLTDTVTCVGGDCITYPGPSYEALFALKLIFRVFGRDPAERTPVGSAVAHAHALLLLSDSVARYLGHSRKEFLPSERPTARIAPRAFQQTVAALTFDAARLDKVLSSRKIPFHFIQPFICEPSDVRPEERWDDHPLLIKPLVSAGRSIVLATPGTVGSACISYIFSSTRNDAAARSALNEAFARESASHLARLLHLMGWQTLSFERDIDDPNTPNVFNALYGFDGDKFAHVQLLVDLGVDADASMTSWPSEDDIWESLIAQQTLADECLLENLTTNLERRLRLLVISGFGRALEVVLQKPAQGHVLHFSLEALNVIVWQRDTDPSSLWKFAQSVAELRRRTRLSTWSELDSYATYVGSRARS